MATPSELVTAVGDQLGAFSDEVDAPDRLGHSFYPDLFVSVPETPALVLVTGLEDPIVPIGEIESLVERGVGVLLVAPRRVSEAAAVLAVETLAVPREVPRVFLSRGSPPEWIVSVPGAVTPQWLAALIGRSGGVAPNLAQLNAARLGFGRSDEALQRALDAGVPAARLVVDRADLVGETLEPLAERVALTTQRRSATTYLVIPVRGTPVVDERILIWGVVAAIGLGLALALVRPRRTRRYLQAILHNIRPITIHFAALTIALIGVNLVLRAVLNLRLDQLAPIWLAAGKLTLGVVVLGLLYTMPVARVNRFTAVYSAGSIFLLMVGALVAGAVSVTLGAFFVFALVMGLGFSLGHNVWLKGLFLLLAFVPGGYLLVALASAADPEMVRTLLTPPLATEVVTAVLLLPLVLMFFRLDALTPRHPLHVVVTMLATTLLAVVTATVIAEVRRPVPWEVAVRERYVRTAETGATGAVEIDTVRDGTAEPPITVAAAGGAIVSCDLLPCRSTTSPPPPPLELSVRTRRVLDRTVLEWEVAFDGAPPRIVDIGVEGAEPLQLYASTVGATQAFGATAETFTFALGPLPPGNVSGEIVLRSESGGAEQSIAVWADAIWPVQPAAIGSAEAGGWRIVDHTREWRDVVTLEASVE